MSEWKLVSTKPINNGHSTHFIFGDGTSIYGIYIPNDFLEPLRAYFALPRPPMPRERAEEAYRLWGQEGEFVDVVESAIVSALAADRAARGVP